MINNIIKNIINKNYTAKMNPDNVENYKAAANIILNVRKLNNIKRWSNEFLHKRASVAEHSFAVSQIAQMLGIIEEEQNNVVDWKKLYMKALNHDVAESVTGDILNSTKNMTKEMKAKVAEVEDFIVNTQLIAGMSKHFESKYREILHDGKDDSLEGQILSAADNIDAYIECVQEIQLGNTIPFKTISETILQKIKHNKLVSVYIFVENILPHLLDVHQTLNDE